MAGLPGEKILPKNVGFVKKNRGEIASAPVPEGVIPMIIPVAPRLRYPAGRSWPSPQELRRSRREQRAEKRVIFAVRTVNLKRPLPFSPKSCQALKERRLYRAFLRFRVFPTVEAHFGKALRDQMPVAEIAGLFVAAEEEFFPVAREIRFEDALFGKRVEDVARENFRVFGDAHAATLVGPDQGGRRAERPENLARKPVRGPERDGERHEIAGSVAQGGEISGAQDHVSLFS